MAAVCRTKLRLNAAAINVPIGLEGNLEGVIDLINMKATYFDGSNGYVARAPQPQPAAGTVPV